MKKREGASFYGIAFALTGILERLTAKDLSTPCAEAHLEPVPSCPDPNLACNRGIVKGMEARADAE
jgi:hypothetical protein